MSSISEVLKARNESLDLFLRKMGRQEMLNAT
jgi:hypothetical protein